jgi:hypothetical protein
VSLLQDSNERHAGAGECAVDVRLLGTHLFDGGRAHGPAVSKSKLCPLFATEPQRYTVHR